MTRSLPWCAVLTALLLAGMLPARAGTGTNAGIAWVDDPRLALDRARQEGRPVLVDTWATWCAPCHEMDRTTFASEAVQAGAGAFVPLKVDADTRQSFLERYGIEVFPTLLLLDADGRELTRREGYVGPDELASLLGAATAGYAAYAAAAASDGPDGDAATGRYFLALGSLEAATTRLRRAAKKLPAGPARDGAELSLAEALLAAGKPRSAGPLLDRLERESTDSALRARVAALRASRPPAPPEPR